MVSAQYLLAIGIVVLAHGLSGGDSAKILMYMGMSSPSHKFAFLTYVDGLMERGHQVTFISPYQTKGAKFRDIAPKLVQEAIQPLVGTNFVDMRLRSDVWSYWWIFPHLSRSLCDALMNSPEVEDIVTGKERFDLVVMDTVVSECGIGLAMVNDVPLMYYSTTILLSWNTAPLGLGQLGLYTTSCFTFHDRDVRNFLDRASTIFVNTLYEWQRHLYFFPTVESMWAKRLGRPVQSFYEIEKNTSMFLLNTHPLVDNPIPYTANIITVGGIHFKPLKPLPKDLEEFASGSDENGFVLVSLGSIVQSQNLPEKYYNAFVEAFRRLPYRIIWKWEADLKHNQLPPNVMIKNWVPQHELLAHPKLRVFVCHGGKLGLLESTKEGVPLVVIPFFADQDIHARKVQDEGFGLHLDLRDVTADRLYNAIQTVASEPRFKEKAMERSTILADQPDEPLTRAVYWTEFVLRHPRGPESRPLSADFWWFQYHMIDVWAFFAALILVPVVSVVIVLRYFLRLLFRKGPTKLKAS